MANAESLPQWGIETAVFRCAAIVRAAPLKKGGVKIKRVWAGTLKIGDELEVKSLSGLSERGYENADMANEAMWKQTRLLNGIDAPPDDIPFQDVANDDFILFLDKDDKGQWEPCGLGAGVKRLHNGAVYGYGQIMNPGGYWLFKDPEASTEEQLESVIETAIAKKSRYLEAIRVVQPNQRAQALLAFVQPDEKTYFYDAIYALAKTGFSGAKILMTQAELPRQKQHRRQFFYYLGITRSPEAVPYLIRGAVRTMERAKRFKTPIIWEKLTSSQQEILSEWDGALNGLVSLKDSRSLALFREALIWGALNDHSLFDTALTGLQNQPDKGNVPAFAQALRTLPFRPNSPYDKQICLRALSENPFRESVPVLADYLISPAADGPTLEDTQQTIRIVHQALVNIVKKDLGFKREPWIEWFQQPEEFKDFPPAPEQTIWY